MGRGLSKGRNGGSIGVLERGRGIVVMNKTALFRSFKYLHMQVPVVLESADVDDLVVALGTRLPYTHHNDIRPHPTPSLMSKTRVSSLPLCLLVTPPSNVAGPSTAGGRYPPADERTQPPLLLFTPQGRSAPAT